MTRSGKASRTRVKPAGGKRPARAGRGGRRPGKPLILDAAAVELYAGYKAGESPRAVFLEGRRIGVAAILERKRIEDEGSGRRREVFSCRLEDGETVFLESLDDGRWVLKFAPERG